MRPRSRGGPAGGPSWDAVVSSLLRHRTRDNEDALVTSGDCIASLMAGDTLVIKTLDRLGRSTRNKLAFADELPSRGNACSITTCPRSTDTARPTGWDGPITSFMEGRPEGGP